MKERLILSPGANGTELVRSLARYGHPSLGLAAVTGEELALRLLDESGTVLGQTFLSPADETALTDAILRSDTVEYFAGASYSDALEISSVLRTLRHLIADEEQNGMERLLSAGPFREKNRALLEVYRLYRDECERRSLADGVSLIRTALVKGKPPEAELLSLREFPCTPLENRLLEYASGGHAIRTDRAALFGVNADSSTIRIVDVTAAYGAGNEVERILGTLLQSGTPLDRAVVALPSVHPYDQLFYEYSRAMDIPMTFGCGIPVMNSNPAKLLRTVLDWSGCGMYGVDALRALLTDTAFDSSVLLPLQPEEETEKFFEEMVKMAGRLRLCSDPEINTQRLRDFRDSLGTKSDKDRKKTERTFQAVCRLSELLACPSEEFVTRYSVIRTGREQALDLAGLGRITGTVASMKQFGPASESELRKALETSLRGNVCASVSAEGCLHLCALQSALSVIRPELFITGLSADVFPGNPKEHYLLLDSDLTEVSDGPTSTAEVKRKLGEFEALVSLEGALGGKTRLSYPEYRTAELKAVNASSVIARFAPDLNVENAGFFTHLPGPVSAVGKAYRKGDRAVPAPDREEQSVKGTCSRRRFSPSSIDTYISCPYKFYLKHLLDIPEPDPDLPATVMDPRDFGTVAHAVLERVTPDTTEEDLLAEASARFEDFLRSRPPVSHQEAERKKREFLTAISGALALDPGNEPLEEETFIEAEHPSGITVYGFPDRVERTPDGKVVVADYKTGQEVHHKEGDARTCLQALLYAFVLESARPYRVDHVEYRYPRAGRMVSCPYDEPTKAEVATILTELVTALEQGEFPRSGSEKDCSRCSFATVCKAEDSGEETEE